MRAPAQRPGDSAGCSGGSGSNSYTGSRHQERTDLWASAAVHHRPVSSGVGQTPPGGQLIPLAKLRGQFVKVGVGRIGQEVVVRAGENVVETSATRLHHQSGGDAAACGHT